MAFTRICAPFLIAILVFVGTVLAFTNRADAQLTITSPSALPAATQGQPYLQTLAASGGVASYNWALVPGSALPDDVVSLLPLSGLLAGTPQVSGQFSFEVRVTDSTAGAQLTATKTFSLTVLPFEIITPSPLPTATQGHSYAQVLTARGGQRPHSWALAPGSALPDGLNLSAISGELSGRPTKSGSFSFTARVMDALMVIAATKTFSLTVLPFEIATPSKLPGGTQGRSYSQTLAVSGGLPRYSWDLAPGSSLPAGLSLHNGSGELSGRLDVSGEFTFQVLVRDQSAGVGVLGALATKTLLLSVAPYQIATASPLPAATQSQSYTQTSAVNGGTAPIAWNIVSGALPTGLSLNGAVLSGTPTVSGSFSFTVRALDGFPGQPAQLTKAFALSVGQFGIATVSPLPAARQGQVYGNTFSVNGGLAPHSWSVVAGTLPTGLNLSGSGTLLGTPTATGSYSFTVRVTDSSAGTALTTTKVFTLTVAPFEITTPTPLSPARRLVQYNQTFTVAGGMSSYTWSVVGSGLPPGLSLAASSGALSGTPTTTGSYFFTVRVTDSSAGTALIATKVFALIVQPALQ